jgi:Spy/CpxP family protein refolding chaperone
MRICLMLALPLVLCAQPPRGPRPWWEGDLTKDANLSEAQIKQINQTRHDFRQRMFEVRAAVNQAEKNVDAAFNEDPVDEAKANDAINRLANARAEATKAVSQMDLKMRMVLTAQQWQDLKQRQRTWPDRPGSHRRGPPVPTPTNSQQK